MANIIFRIKKSVGKSTIYFRHTINSKQVEFKSPFSINFEEWDNIEKKRIAVGLPKRLLKPEDIAKKNEVDLFNIELNAFKSNIEKFIIQEKASKTFNANNAKEKISTFLNELTGSTNQPIKKQWLASDYFDKYIADKTQSIAGTTEITKGTADRYKVLRNRLVEYDKKLMLHKIDNTFKTKYMKFVTELEYGVNTIVKDMNTIMSVIRYAIEQDKLDIPNDALSWNFSKIESDFKAKKEDYTEPYFSIEDLQAIANTKLYYDYLSNARDWLLIGCYTGQRVSDLLKINTNDISETNGHYFANITQKKTGKKISIPLMPAVMDILKKNEMNFPRQITDQKFNEYIKEVCKQAGFTELINGAKQLKVNVNGQQRLRKIFGKYPKHELITSHTCRRTCVSILVNAGLDKDTIKNITGHSSDEMIALYTKLSTQEKGMLAMNSLLKISDKINININND